MKGFENPMYLVLYIIFNVVAVLMLRTAWKQPRIARLFFVVLFGWASCTNWTVSLNNPQFYMQYADSTFSEAYRQFIRGWFSRHITVTVGFIATCQALIAVAMLLKGSILRAGIISGIIFLLAIAPLGVATAFPFSITASLALYFMLQNEENDYLWVNAQMKYGYSH